MKKYEAETKEIEKLRRLHGDRKVLTYTATEKQTMRQKKECECSGGDR